MEFRKGITLLFVVFAVVLTLTFGFGAYLLMRRNVASSPPQDQSSKSLPQNQNSSQLLVIDAQNQLKNSQVEQASMAFRRALSLNPLSLEAQLGLAQCEFLAGREEEAAQEYVRALGIDNNNNVALRQLALLYSHQKKTWSASEFNYKKYLTYRPDDVEAQLELARVLAWEGKSREATEIFSRTSLTKLMTTRDWRDYAFALVKSDQEEKAEPLLKKLLLNAPRDMELRLQLASIYGSRKDWDSALPLYKSILQERPNDPRLNMTYGLGLLSQKMYKEALAPLEKARVGMPTNGEAGLGYARALKGAGNLKKSVKEFERVVPQYQTNPAITREFADLLLEKRDYSKSEKYYKAAYQLGLHDERLLVGLAGALNGSGKPKEALPFMEEAYKRQPTDRLAFELAKLYQKLGHRDQALVMLNRVETSAQRSSR